MRKFAFAGALLILGLSASCETLRLRTEQRETYTVYRVTRARWGLDIGIPTTNNLSRILDRDWYAVGYSDHYCQPIWTSYRLTDYEVSHSSAFSRDELKFRTELLGGLKSVNPRPEDYTGSGYDRGHMVPAGDMSWSLYGLEDTFYMSNICPQTPLCNRGVWKQLEQWVRDNAKLEKELWVVSGPIFSTNAVQKTIGKHCNVTVPEAFFKVVYDATEPVKALGFIVPNEGCTNALDWYTVTVDDVEKRTNMKFFELVAPNLQPDKTDFHPSLWNWNILSSSSLKMSRKAD